MIGAAIVGFLAGAIGRMLWPGDPFRHMSGAKSWGVSLLLGLAGAALGYLIFTVGLGIEGEEGMEVGAVAGAEAAEDGIEVFSDEDAWDVLQDIPNDTAAALVLIEHHWAVPLRDAVVRAGGFRISDGFISSLLLIAAVAVGCGGSDADKAKTQACDAARPRRDRPRLRGGGRRCPLHAIETGAAEIATKSNDAQEYRRVRITPGRSAD